MVHHKCDGVNLERFTVRMSKMHCWTTMPKSCNYDGDRAYANRCRTLFGGLNMVILRNYAPNASMSCAGRD